MRVALSVPLTLALALPAGAGAKRPPVTPAHDGYETEVQAVPQIAQILRSKGPCVGRLVPSATPTTNSWGESFFVTVGPW